ncbi:hypothetical protein SAMN05421780_11086 [Flexibacter flexilis DSM 6793]|uniref:Uncharacterized protein n=1 Tax=Flexibacter flexilis DSM 6793 TaxID=927664 RepID=A0A1I1MAS9_9BACT|nr:hypothetical protein SAMN05421780_11086 [Flexibacter flexilis DSM 6793]
MQYQDNTNLHYTYLVFRVKDKSFSFVRDV